MNFFKRMIEEIKNRLKTDVKFKDNKMCLTVEWDSDNVSEENAPTFCVSVIGADCPIGGIFICFLTSKGDMYSHMCPKLDVLSNKFVFLNGFLMPTAYKDGRILSEALGVNHCNDYGEFVYNRSSFLLEHGYQFEYLYIPPKGIHEIIEDADNVGMSVEDYVVEESVVLYPDGDPLLCRVNIDDDTKDNTLINLICNNFQNMPGSNTEFISKETSTNLLVSDLAIYCYSNLLVAYQDRLSSQIGKRLDDIPMEKEGQEKWLKKLYGSLDKEKGDYVKKYFVK